MMNKIQDRILSWDEDVLVPSRLRSEFPGDTNVEKVILDMCTDKFLTPVYRRLGTNDQWDVSLTGLIGVEANEIEVAFLRSGQGGKAARLTPDPYEFMTVSKNSDGSIRWATGDLIALDNWAVHDRTDHWWMVWNRELIVSQERHHLVGWREHLRGNREWHRLDVDGSECYSEDDVHSIRRSRTGLVFIAVDGQGIELVLASHELKDDDV